jgi:cytochrome c-type biogenesis protein CcmE
MKRKHKRLSFVLVGLGLLAAAAALVLSASRDAIVFFKSPTEIATQPVAPGRRIRVGGLVEPGSVEAGKGKTVSFRITDVENTVPVVYTGILPDLFREGQGVVAEGVLDQGVFVADQVLAKHDETYMPPEVADALKKSGQWQHMRQSMEQAGQLRPAEAGR